MSLAETAPVVAAPAGPHADSSPAVKLHSDPDTTSTATSTLTTSIKETSSSVSAVTLTTEPMTTVSASLVSVSAATPSAESSSIITTAPSPPGHSQTTTQTHPLPIDTQKQHQDNSMASRTPSSPVTPPAPSAVASSSPILAPLSPSPSVSSPTQPSSLPSVSASTSAPTISTVKTEAISPGPLSSSSVPGEAVTAPLASPTSSTGPPAPTPTSLSPSPSSMTSSSSMNNIDKGRPIPTSNALSSSLRSRISTSAPLSSLSSVTETTIISPKPYPSHPHISSAPLSSFNKADASLRHLGGSSYSNAYPTPASKYEDIHISSPKAHSQQPHFPQSKTQDGDIASKDDHPSALYRVKQEEEYEEVYEMEGEEYEVVGDEEMGESDVEIDRESGMEMEHDLSRPDDRDANMVDISVESLSSTQGKKRLASPDSSSTLANEDDSRSKTLSPNPSTKSGTDAAGSSQPNKTLGSAVKKESKPGVTGTSCANCGTTKTPLWRRASDGQTICNACGLYYKARNLTRPPWLKRNMGLKKGDTATGETDDLEDGNVRAASLNPTSKSGPSSIDGASLDDERSTAESTKAASQESEEKPSETEPCPGDGNCNGAGGTHTCSGCPSYNQQQSNRQHLVCANCRTTTTPLWRRDSSGNTICNACGLYYKLHNVHRPVTMKRAVIRRRKRVIPPSPPPSVSQNMRHQPQHLQPQQPSQLQGTRYPSLQGPRSSPPTSSMEGQGDPKRRRIQSSNGARGGPSMEEYILPKPSGNDYPDRSQREQGSNSYRRSMSPIDNISNGEQNHHHSNSPHHQGSSYSQQQSRSQEGYPHGHAHLGPSRYMPSAHSVNRHYHSTPSASMSRYPVHHVPPHSMPPQPHQGSAPSMVNSDVKTNTALASLMTLSSSGGPNHPGSTVRHDDREMQHMAPPPPSQQSMPLYSKAHNQTQHPMYQHPPHSYAHNGHAPRDLEEGMHPSSQYASGWNQRLPGYSTVSTSSTNIRLSSTGIVHSTGPPPPGSPPHYSRYPPYHHPHQPYRNQGPPPPGPGHDYRPPESPQSQGASMPPAQGGHHYSTGSSPTQSNVMPNSSGYSAPYHHSGPSDPHVDRERAGSGGGNSAHLPPISLPHPPHQSHHQPLPRATDLLHQQEQGPPPPHHHHYNGHGRQPSPPSMPMNGAAIGASGNHVAPASSTNTDVLQQTRKDLQREVSHLSMLLGRAAAVLNGLDHALDSHHSGASSSPPVTHSPPIGHGYGPPPPSHGHGHGHSHGHAHGHGPPPPPSQPQLQPHPPPQQQQLPPPPHHNQAASPSRYAPAPSYTYPLPRRP